MNISPKDVERFWGKVNREGKIPEHMPHLGPCWEWTAACFNNGYGAFSVNRVNKHAHRVSWVIANGQIPDGLFACHHCDRKKCVRPEHLFLGTQQDNMDDCKNKGRVPRGDKSFPALHPGRMARGDANGSRKHPERLARGDNHYSRTNPEKLARGDRSGARLHPERLARGDANGARKYPERLKRGESVASAKLTEADVLEVRKLHSEGMNYSEIGRLFGVSHKTTTRIVKRLTWNHVP